MPRNTGSGKAQELPPLLLQARDSPVAFTLPLPLPRGEMVLMEGRQPGGGGMVPRRRGGPSAPPRLLEILHSLSARMCFALGQLGGGEGGRGRLAPAGRRVSRPERGEAEDCFIRTYRGATEAGSSMINPTKAVSAGPGSAGAKSFILGRLRRNFSLCLGGKELFGF